MAATVVVVVEEEEEEEGRWVVKGGGHSTVVVIGGRNGGYSDTVKHSSGETFSPASTNIVHTLRQYICDILYPVYHFKETLQ